MNLPEGEKSEFVVTDEGAGARVDLFLSMQRDLLTRSRVKKIIDEGLVWVNGKHAKPSARLRAGDIVVAIEKEPRECSIAPEDIPLAVVYEDSSILLVDKPAGMVVHPAAGHFSGTLVNALMFHCDGLSGIGGVKRPGIIHRLDKNTSGIMIVAKTDEAHIGLSQQFKSHRVKKIYQALVHGDVKGESGTIERPIGRHPKDRKKMSARSRRGKSALTRWNVFRRFGRITLLEVRIETGRTHQIRVHLNDAGYPVVGDDVYGNSKKRINTMAGTELAEALKKIKRQALHACLIGFHHPVTDAYMEFTAPLSADMTGLCKELERLQK
ncbi:MAG: RluA family pseudouridine synthase [Deltaproteobacteria bacterium]|nr:RluA family pseudouridine synthase [Deltaproteobacteria bacterium]